jgi:putative oxidoreductase
MALNSDATQGARSTSLLAKLAPFAVWMLRILLVAMFLMAGAKKLLGAPAMNGLFDQIGVGSWFQYFTGGVEVAAAVLLLVPATGFVGGLLIVATMAGAAIVNLTVSGIDRPMPKLALSLILLVLGALVAWASRPAALRSAAARLR